MSPTTLSNTVLITGNTYPVKDQIKALGGTWNKLAKGWTVPAGNAETARALVASAPVSTFQPAAPRPGYGRGSRYRSHHYRFSSGAEAFQNKAGRCVDAPCCGCCC